MIRRLVIVLSLGLCLGFGSLTLPGAPAAPAPVAASGAPAVPLSELDQLGQDLKNAIGRVQPLLDRYGYVAVFVAVMVEGVGIPAPGQTLLIAAAVTAVYGHLSITWVLLCACLAAVLGNTMGYLMGHWGGRALLAGFRVSPQRLDGIKGYFHRYGKGVVLCARFFDGLRQLNGIVAGMLAMPWKVFTVVNILGAVLWTGVWGGGGYFLAEELNRTHGSFTKLNTWVAAGTVLLFLALIIYLLHGRRRDQTDEKQG